MKIVEKIQQLQQILQPYRNKGKLIGFVPTMGALHQGHAALVKQCATENDVTVVSIFVNPTQFNNPDDLRLYPRTPEADYALLQEIGVDYVFAPSVEEMYPEPDTRQFDFGMLDKVMEGQFRPGHFNGVAQVVSKLFDAVKPDKSYFGEKDFQQLAIVREMVKQLKLPVEIIGAPIVRETSGLAMSSRNERLSAEERENAAEIYKTLQKSAEWYPDKNPADIIRFVTDNINKTEGLRVEYFEIIDADTLQPVSDWSQSESIVGCIAVFCGNVRLIDNVSYTGKHSDKILNPKS